MTYEEITAMMQEIGLPCAYHHFAEGESPPPPFVVYLSPGEHTFHADNINYYSWKRNCTRTRKIRTQSSGWKMS